MRGERLPCQDNSWPFDEIINVAPSVGGRGRPDPWVVEEAADMCCSCPFFDTCILDVFKDEYWANIILGVRRRRMRQKLAS